MPQTARRTAEDFARLISYVIGATWGILFLIWTPSTYRGVMDPEISSAWALLAVAGTAIGAIGVITRRDAKVELAGLYVTQVAGLLYLVAQLGFFSTAAIHSSPSPTAATDRIAFAAYVLWHASLMWPRIAALETYRRAVHRQRKITL